MADAPTSEEEKKLTRKEKKEQKKLEKENKKKKKGKKGDQDETDEEDDDEDGGGIGMVIIAALFIILVWVAIIALIIRMDVAGIGTKVYPYLQNIPVVNKVLPPDVEILPEDSAYTFSTMDAAIARIQELEQQLADSESAGGGEASRVAQLEALVAELQPYKDNYDAFQTEKQKFYEEVVFSDKAPDIEQYKAYYESIDPANAETIYRSVVEQLQESERIKDYAAAYSSMKPAQAATIFDSMTNDFPLVARILWTMDAESRGNILALMKSENAAALTRMMQP